MFVLLTQKSIFRKITIEKKCLSNNPHKKTVLHSKSVCKTVCNCCNLLIINSHCGERGIRTPGSVTYVGFQDRCIKPLCHLSKARQN